MSTKLELKIDGDATVMHALVHCELTEAMDTLDALVAVFAVHHHTTDTTILDKVKVGMPYEVALKEDDNAVNTCKGDIIEVRHTRRGDRHRITAIGMDSLHRLADKHAPAQLWDVAHDAIVQEIASRNNLTASAEGVDGTAAEILQNDGSDALFLKRLAAENNYFVRVQDSELVFGRRQGSGSITIDIAEERNTNLEQRTSLTGIVTKVTVHGSDYVQDEAFTGVAEAADLKDISSGTTGVSVVNDMAGAREIILNQTGYSDASRANARAKGELQRRAEQFVRGGMWVDGNPNAISGKSLTVSNAGWPFDGTFLVHQTIHRLVGQNYSTRIEYLSDSLPENTA